MLSNTLLAGVACFCLRCAEPGVKQHSRGYRNAAGRRCNLTVLSNGLRRFLSGPGQCSRRGLGSWWQEKRFLTSFLDSFPPLFFQTCSVAAPGKFYFRRMSQRVLDRTRCKAGTFLLWGIRHSAALLDQHVQYDLVTICLRRAWTFLAW